MAVTKIIAIRDRLDKRVNYVVNSEKTSLDAGVAYITNPEKTEQTFFTKTINCHTIETAYAEMMDTKRYWNKMGGVLGFHIIQSFVPGEVTPTQAHEIGMEFCKRLFKGRFQVVIGTHLDKKHLHNHRSLHPWDTGVAHLPVHCKTRCRQSAPAGAAHTAGSAR